MRIIVKSKDDSNKKGPLVWDCGECNGSRSDR